MSVVNGNLEDGMDGLACNTLGERVHRTFKATPPCSTAKTFPFELQNAVVTLLEVMKLNHTAKHGQEQLIARKIVR